MSDIEYEEFDEPYNDEPCGSCQYCGCNLYYEDDLDLCDQCLWMIERARNQT